MMNSLFHPTLTAIRALGLAMIGTGLLSSCGLLRDATHPAPPPTETTDARTPIQVDPGFAAIQSPPAYGPMLKGSMEVELLIGKENYSSKVNATIVRGQGIYWSVVPFPLIEAARVWFLPEGVTAIDKLHGRYAEVTYSELSALIGFTVQYDDVERLLLGKAFFPAGSRGMRGGAFSYVRTSDGGTDAEASLSIPRGSASGAYHLRWLLNAQQQPTSVTVRHTSAQGSPVFSLRYDQTAESLARHFAERTQLFLGQATRPALSIDWSKLRNYTGEQPDLTPRIKASYQRITLTELIKLLPSL